MPENETKPLQFLKCPHCGEDVDKVETRTYGEGGKIIVIGCGKCLKVIGGNMNTN